MSRRINGLRWRVARLFAPDPIMAQPLGDSKVYLLLRDSENSWAWVQCKTLELELKSGRPIGDPFALGNWEPSEKGTFSGTVG